MNPGKLFLYWIATVIGGSILSPLMMIVSINDITGPNPLETFPLFFFISLVLSVPAILVLWIAINHYNKKEMPAEKRRQTLLLIHLLCAVLTFAIIQITTGAPFQFIGIIAFSYTSIGMILWLIGFRNEEKGES